MSTKPGNTLKRRLLTKINQALREWKYSFDILLIVFLPEDLMQAWITLWQSTNVNRLITKSGISNSNKKSKTVCKFSVKLAADSFDVALIVEP